MMTELKATKGHKLYNEKNKITASIIYTPNQKALEEWAEITEAKAQEYEATWRVEMEAKVAAEREAHKKELQGVTANEQINNG